MGLVPVVLLLLPVAFIFRVHGWRAGVFFWPGSVRLEALSLVPADLPLELATLGRELLALGFTFLGAHGENPRLGPPLLAFDFISPEGVWATLGPKARVYFLNATPGGLVLTAGFARRTAQDARFVAIGMPRVPLARALAQHRRRVARGETATTLGGRLALARSFYGPDGAAELKRQHAISVLWVVAAVLAVALALLRSL